jgi:hypothetical protein
MDVKSELCQCPVCGIPTKNKESLVKFNSHVINRALKFLILNRRLRAKERYQGDDRDFTYFQKERDTLHGMLVYCVNHPAELVPGNQLFSDIMQMITLKKEEEALNDREVLAALKNKEATNG